MVILDIFNDISALLDEPIYKILAFICTTSGLAIGLIRFIRKRIKNKWSDFDDKIFSEVILLQQQENYIPNDILNLTTNQKFTSNAIKSSIDQFIDTVLLDKTNDKKSPFCFVKAGTGTGKTTFLINLFTTYKSSASFFEKLFRRKPNIILLNYNAIVFDRKDSIINKYNSMAKNTILLIDALDEFEAYGYDPVQNESFSTFYKRAFEKKWREMESRLSGFKKVILTTRSQIDGVETILNNNRDNSVFELQMFSETQAIQYIDKCAKNNKYANKAANVTAIWSILEYQIEEEQSTDGFKLSRLPLILSYLELLSDNINEIKTLIYSHTLSLAKVIDLIIQKWIEREMLEKTSRKVDNEELNSLGLFCQNLAYKIFCADDRMLLSAKTFHELDTSKYFTYLFKQEERSLLKKVSQKKRDLATGEIDAGNTDSFGFVHRVFFEYFLGEYVARIENNNAYTADYNQKIEKIKQYPLAQEVFILKRWDAIKITAPKTRPNIINEFNLMPFEDIKLWHHFFMRFSQHKYLMQCFRDRGMELIQKYDKIGYKIAFAPLKNLTILNNNELDKSINNFWNINSCQPYSEAFDLIPIIQEFIVAIAIENITNLKELEHLKCFEGVKQIKYLLIQLCNIKGESLSYFKNSKESLKQFCLQINQIKNDEEVFAPFDGADKLEILNLSGNKITGKCLNYFKDSTDLEHLGVANNPISSVNIEPVLLQYKNLRKLRIDDDVLIKASSLHQSLVNRGVEIEFCTKNEQIANNQNISEPSLPPAKPTQSVDTKKEAPIDYYKWYEKDNLAIAKSKEANSKKRNTFLKEPKIGRKDPCPCGSGTIYKECHGLSL